MASCSALKAHTGPGQSPVCGIFVKLYVCLIFSLSIFFLFPMCVCFTSPGQSPVQCIWAQFSVNRCYDQRWKQQERFCCAVILFDVSPPRSRVKRYLIYYKWEGNGPAWLEWLQWWERWKKALWEGDSVGASWNVGNGRRQISQFFQDNWLIALWEGDSERFRLTLFHTIKRCESLDFLLENV